MDFQIPFEARDVPTHRTDPRAQEFIAHMEMARGREAQGCDGEEGHHLWV
jgi:hypothetical protein